jgi:hypothetical protein
MKVTAKMILQILKKMYLLLLPHLLHLKITIMKKSKPDTKKN